MANPRQRRKAKSSTHKAISHSKRAKRLQKKMPTIRGPKALQDAWDPTKTLRQNYLTLGLQHDLNPISSGGSEVNLSRTISQNNTIQLHPTAPSSIIEDDRPSAFEGPIATSALPKGFGRIIRDQSGNVVRVELPSDDEAGHAPQRELVIDTSVVTTEPELRTWARDHPQRRQGADSGDVESTIVQEGQLTPRTHLKNLATSATVRERYTSLGERSYLDRLVKKHGDDFHKMARDRLYNPEQRTANELRRAIAKAGGPGALCKSMDTNLTQ